MTFRNLHFTIEVAEILGEAVAAAPAVLVAPETRPAVGSHIHMTCTGQALS